MKLKSALACTLLVLTGAHAQSPATQAVIDVGVGWEARVFDQRPSSMNVFDSLRITLCDPSAANYHDLSYNLLFLTAKVGEATYYFVPASLESPKELEQPAKISLGVKAKSLSRGEAAAASIAPPVAKALTRFLAIHPDMPADQRAAGLKAKREQLETLKRRANMLRTIIDGNNRGSRPPLIERIATLVKARDALTEEAKSREMRLDVLRSQKERLLSERNSQLIDDAISRELRRMVQLRQEKLKEIQNRVEKGAASRSELLDGQTAVAEAELRLAERAAAVSVPGMASSLEQINLEMTKVSIDLEEYRRKLKNVEQQLAPFDLKNPTTQSLEAAVEADVSRDNPKAEELLESLDRQITQTRMEILGLLILRIEPMASDKQ